MNSLTLKNPQTGFTTVIYTDQQNLKGLAQLVVSDSNRTSLSIKIDTGETVIIARNVLINNIIIAEDEND